ncbi:hypothetical protein BVC71_12990 [Marivivens niveibacter]|uniref:F5/8 type C domain-containing protein n=1 Tax=Marivivens niveibacter TaxID=1930667 RepID=A0A251WVA8_9RHOB|nr:hypothetical protein BVC71_12990 [Marivivens niveibacter]
MLGCTIASPSFAQSCDNVRNLTIVSATDEGFYEETHGPENTIDGDFDPDSRWSSESQGAPRSIVLDLGAQQTVSALDVAWYKGDSRKSTFSIEMSEDGQSYTAVRPFGETSGQTLEFERYDLSPMVAQYVRILGDGNESNAWNSIVEINVVGCGESVEAPITPVLTPRRSAGGMFGLDPTVAPAMNFDLTGWYVTTPADDNADGKSDSVYENELAAGWTDPRYFFTDPATGGMVFISTTNGAKTSANTNYSRTELRGMLRAGDETIATRVDGGYPNQNNWVFSSAPIEAQAAAGGVDGVMRATLSVNQVTRQGIDSQIGRVIIGQIHAKDDEPIRLYYRKLPQNKFGSIYFAHEPATGPEQWVEIIGSRANWAPNPDDGIALDEVFSYEIKVDGLAEGDAIIPMLYVKIIRDDGSVVESEPFDMRNSGFSVADEFMFFKAGAYSQNNSSPDPARDFDRVTFFALDYEHDEPPAHEGGAEPINSAPVDVPMATAGVIFDDSFTDGGRDDGADATDVNWWTTTTSAAIEVGQDSLGLVSGTSGRGIRTVFEPQRLAVGQTLQSRFDFVTPETIGTDRDSAFRIGLFDTLGREQLRADLSASSSRPQPLYDGLPGYMIAFDVGMTDATQSAISVLRHNVDTQGRLLGTTKGYSKIGRGGDPYEFRPNTAYTGVISVTRDDDGLTVAGELYQDGVLVSTFAVADPDTGLENIGMLAFHVNSKTFGSSKDPNTADNGIDFTNVRIDVIEN